MYKLVTIAATVVIASTVSSFAQVSQAQHNRATASLSGEIQTNRGQIATNSGAIDNLGRVVTQHDDAIGGIGQLSQRITALESRTVTNGVDGQDGARGERGLTGAAGRDGQDADISGLYEELGATFTEIQTDFEDARVQTQMGIAGASALSFANNGGSGVGIGIAAHQGFNAGALSYTQDIGNSFSASIGATTTGTVGAGVKWKF